MKKNMDEGQTSSILATRAYATKIKGKYEIFRALQNMDMTIEVYVRKNTRIRYLELRPYSKIYHLGMYEKKYC